MSDQTDSARLRSRSTRVARLATAIFFIFSLGYGLQTIGIPMYIHSISHESQGLARYYVDPDSVQITFPEKKRNIIYLFAESMESSYTARKYGGAFEENYIPHLTDLALDDLYIQFSHTDQLGGAFQTASLGWTIAGLVGHSAGIPLKLPITDEEYKTHDLFLPGVKGLGDILQDEGYYLEFLMGSDAEFGGRKQYLEQHGNFVINDYPQAIADGRLAADYKVGWGYEDEKLFAFTKERISNLAEGDVPFYFGLLTLDTHFPNGHVYEDMDQPFDFEYGNAIYGSDTRIYEFVRWFEEQSFAEDTTLIIAGDHLTMANKFVKDTPSGYVRTTYNLLVNPVADLFPERNHNRMFNTLDMFPTTLAAIGVDIEGDQLAYGVNLFSDRKTLLEELGWEEYDQMMRPYSSFYENTFIFSNR
ncbi:MAG: sulfatase-like hydrolase/transferase [Fastidiosipilaceae bacterium]|jgi:phosphoglycerol transferase